MRFGGKVDGFYWGNVARNESQSQPFREQRSFVFLSRSTTSRVFSRRQRRLLAAYVLSE